MQIIKNTRYIFDHITTRSTPLVAAIFSKSPLKRQQSGDNETIYYKNVITKTIA